MNMNNFIDIDKLIKYSIFIYFILNSKQNITYSRNIYIYILYNKYIAIYID